MGEQQEGADGQLDAAIETGTALVDAAVRGPAVWITLSREAKLNALNREMLLGLERALTAARQVDGARALVLAGSGQRAFCAGADLGEVKGTAPHEFLPANMLGHQVFDAVRSHPLPVIAAINGVALGGGLELALACDLRLAVAGARLGLPEVSVGVLPGWGGTWRLAEAVGAAKARELVLTGELIEAQDAARLGLVSAVVGDVAQLRRRVEEQVQQLAANSGTALAYAKALLNAAEHPAGVHAAAESGYVGSLLGSEHFRSATQGF